MPTKTFLAFKAAKLIELGGSKAEVEHLDIRCGKFTSSGNNCLFHVLSLEREFVFLFDKALLLTVEV
jgi:hypothetical protein